MEPLKDAISVRIARINSEIVGKTTRWDRDTLLARESLLDILQALFEECNLENLRKYDSNIMQFVSKYKDNVSEIKQLRVNLSDFEIKNVIGRGHFGEVHLVKEKQTGDLYAMKTLRKFDNDISHVSFEAERNIMAFSNSHWLTSLQYAFQDNSYLFFIMDYHPGGDLLGLLHRQGGTLPESAATFYLAELVLALEDLHKLGYVHRDIKPDNILLDRCGHLKLADFGSAAKLNKNGLVTVGPPVGTPDYIAPEVLQCLDNKKSGTDTCTGYGVTCDFWSLGILAYELIIGSTPFTGQSSTSVYSKIMNHNSTLKFPSDVTLSHAYVNFVKSLIKEEKLRLSHEQIKIHDLFINTKFDHLRDQVPPFVPKITSSEDVSNFSDIPVKKKYPSIENFKKRSQFSGRNLPFIGFTFTPDIGCYDNNYERKYLAKDEVVQGLKSEVECLRKQLVEKDGFDQEKSTLETKLGDKERKLENLEGLRDKLERDLANTMAENMALKRTLEFERKDRIELEKKALDLIKGAKLKWEIAERTKVEALTLELEQQKEKISQLAETNNILNEQLQHALKLENKHKESLEKVHDLSRRSVIGLESRLDKMTSEAQVTITELQKKLTEEIHQKAILENNITHMKDKENALLKKLEESEQNFEHWKGKIEEAEDVIKKLSQQVSILEKDVDKISKYKEEIAKLQQVIDNNQKIAKDLENRNTLLQIETKTMDGYKRELDEMKKMMLKLQDDTKVTELETQLLEEKEKCLALKKQLQESENILTENQELKELRTKYWRIERELGNYKIDKRILERELKDAGTEIKQLKEKIENFDKTLDEKKKIHESALLELSSINESLSLELMKIKDSYKNMLDKLNNEKQKSDLDKIVINELKDIIKTKERQANNFQLEINVLQKNKMELEDNIKKVELEKNKLLEVLEKLQKEKSELFDELDKSKRQIEHTHLNLEALREACTLLEGQVIEYENINSSHETKQAEFKSNTEKLIQDLCQAGQEIQETKKLVNEEKSLKLLAETKMKRLSEEVECLQNECKSYKEQCMEYKRYSSELSDGLGIAEEKITNLEVTLKTFERQVDDLRTEIRIVKEENTDHLTQLNKTKESNYKLRSQLNESKSEKVCLMQKINELERILNEKSNFYKERELKSEATIKQQIKLIDYLQSKVDELNNKKRTITEVLFGGSKKENQPPISLAMNYKELESQLWKEKEANRQLHEEVYKLKAATTVRSNNVVASKLERHQSEILSPKSKVAMQQIVNSPSKQKSDLYRQPSLQRMHHNIPHRFASRLCTKSLTKCAGCSEAVSLGRTINVCSECNITIHINCAKVLPNTCGLPRQYVTHYKDSLEPKEDAPILEFGNDVINVEGWIKVPSKSNGWEKKYACLTDKAVNIFTEPPKEKTSILLQSFLLKPESTHGKVILEPLTSEIGVPVANSDLPFILKIEVAPNTTCWPPKCLIFMTLSAQDKDKWFSALQTIYYSDFSKPKYDHILTLPEHLGVNIFLELTENIRLLGTEKGLYSTYDNKLLHIDGLAEVHQISLMNSINTVLMIVGKNRELILCDLNHLINLTQCAQCTKPKLKYTQVNVKGLNGFHILQVSTYSKQQKASVATSKQLVILVYDIETNNFIPCRILDTAEPTSCMLFTENSLIVGVNKFFEIDIATYEAEEFLDASDIKLRQAEKCYKMKSFPLAILQVSSNPKEYLLCFNEFSVFVDEYGRSTRNAEIKSTHLPLSFHFSKPYLYIVQFAAIEIMKVSDETCNTSSNESLSNLDHTRVEFEKFQCIGSNKRGIYIQLGSEIKFVDAKKIMDDDSSTIASETTENDSDRFSFTSSMVQSLDGHLSDSESVDEKQRKVRFSQTNL